MNSQWLHQLKLAVSPLEEGVGKLRVNNFRPSDEGQLRPGRTAAVLVPILDLPEPEVVLTTRALHLVNHPCRPGGYGTLYIAIRTTGGCSLISDAPVSLAANFVHPAKGLSRTRAPGGLASVSHFLRAGVLGRATRKLRIGRRGVCIHAVFRGSLLVVVAAR